MSVTVYSEDDLRALKERNVSGGDQDAKEIAAVVDEVLAARKAARHEARRDIMMMAAAIASELGILYGVDRPEGREYIAQLAVSLAFEIEKATPR